jgi:hypothetical protein
MHFKNAPRDELLPRTALIFNFNNMLRPAPYHLHMSHKKGSEIVMRLARSRTGNSINGPVGP